MCKVCKREEHILVDHIVKKHEMSPVDYLDKYPGAALWSSYGLAVIKRLNTESAVIAATPRPKRKVALKKLFPQFGLRKGYEITGDYAIFDTAGELTPTLDKTYLFPEEQTLDFLTIIEKTIRNRIYIKGWSGTGKTTLVFNIAALVNAEVMEWNADSFQQRGSLIGQWTVRNGETFWEDGILPRAMKRGCWLVINEMDMLDPHTTNILKPALEDPARLTILEHHGEVVHAHPDFRVIATANTWARGDDTGMFVNTHVQSDADARRWSVRIALDYMEKEAECQMLRNIFGDKLGDEEKDQDPKDSPEKFIAVAAAVRDAFKAGKIDKTFSPAELINWAENYLTFGKGIHHAARLSFLNALTPDVSHAIYEFINATFGQEKLT